MKRCLFATFACSVCLTAQQSNVSSTTQVDVNGNVIPDGPTTSQTRSASGSDTKTTTQSINGRTVPLEQVEERVLRNDSSGKVTERITQRYDPQGNPLPPVRQIVEEQKRLDGSSNIQSTTYRADINGNSQIIEKSVTDTQKTASGETTETVVQRPTSNGLEAVEKQSQVVSKEGDNFRSENIIYRNDGNGSFYQAVRQATEHTVQGPSVSDNTVEYESGPNGELQIHGQTVSKTVVHPDGSTDAVVNIYSRDVPGTVSGNESGLKLQEQQVIESSPGPGNTMVQTLNVRRPTLADPGTLGPARQLSQTVCKGDCKPPKSDK